MAPWLTCKVTWYDCLDLILCYIKRTLLLDGCMDAGIADQRVLSLTQTVDVFSESLAKLKTQVEAAADGSLVWDKVCDCMPLLVTR